MGIAYNIKPSGTVLRISYARTLETPFNENLVLSSTAARMRCLRPLLLCNPGVSGTMDPGYRNEFHAGLQQAIGKNVVFSGEYIWKYTHNAFDFSVLGNTPITFPIDWHNSKIPGYALHVEVPELPQLQRLFCHVLGGCALLPAAGGRRRRHQRSHSGNSLSLPHRSRREVQRDHPRPVHVSHDGSWFNGLWGGFNWRYDSRPRRWLRALLRRHRSQQPLRRHLDHLARRPSRAST